MAHYEKTLHSTDIYSGKVVHLTRDEVELENGSTSSREIVHHHGGACVLALTPEHEVYLVKQFRYATGREMWELPAGKLEKGENPFEAARRELSEETGVTASQWRDLGYIYPTVGYCTERIYMYLAQDLHPASMHLDADEFLDPYRMPLDDLVQRCMNGEIQDAKTVIGVLKVKALADAGEV